MRVRRAGLGACTGPYVCDGFHRLIAFAGMMNQDEGALESRGIPVEFVVEIGDGAVVVLVGADGERPVGGLFLCDPTPGYRLQQGKFTNLPILSAEERDVLIEAAVFLDEAPQPGSQSCTPGESAGDRPGDEFNARADIRPVLEKHGWTRIREGANEHWRRPGKDSGTSATLKDGVFYVFSSNAAPFESDKGYSPFQVYALLEHGGDFNAAARRLREEGFGAEADPCQGVDLSSFLANLPDPINRTEETAPTPLSELFETVTELDPPIIHGLLREGETMNVIASSKMGKALAIDTPILTELGWKTMGELRPGIPGGKAQVIAARLANDPSVSTPELAAEYEVTERYIRQIRQALETQGAPLNSRN